MFTRSSTRFDHVTDGTSQTFFFGERGWGWVMCGGSECEQYLSLQNGLLGPHNGPTSSITVRQFWSWHPGGVLFLFADGHVQFLNVYSSYRALQALATKSGAELVGEY